MENKIDKNTLQEAYVIFNKLDLFNCLPEELKAFILMNKNNEHKFDFNENRPLLEQLDNEATRIFVSYIHINYISNKNVDVKSFLEEILDKFN